MIPTDSSGVECFLGSASCGSRLTQRPLERPLADISVYRIKSAAQGHIILCSSLHTMPSETICYPQMKPCYLSWTWHLEILFEYLRNGFTLSAHCTRSGWTFPWSCCSNCDSIGLIYINAAAVPSGTSLTAPSGSFAVAYTASGSVIVYTNPAGSTSTSIAPALYLLLAPIGVLARAPQALRHRLFDLISYSIPVDQERWPANLIFLTWPLSTIFSALLAMKIAQRTMPRAFLSLLVQPHSVSQGKKT